MVRFRFRLWLVTRVFKGRLREGRAVEKRMGYVSELRIK